MFFIRKRQMQGKLNSTIINKLPYIQIDDEDNDKTLVGERGNVINHLNMINL